MSRRAFSLTESNAGNRRANQSGSKRSKASTRRLAKASAGALLLALATTIGTLYFGAKQHPAAIAEVINCPLPLPEAGPARPWENEIGVSPYSRVNTRTRNLFTAIPLAHVPMRGPDADIVLYHNSANVGTAAPPTTNVRFDLGPGWTPAHSDQIVFGTYDATVMYANGTRDKFTRNGAEYAPAHGVHDRLIPVDSLIWHVVHKDQSYHEFVNNNDAVRLHAFCDRAGICLNPEYENLGEIPPALRFESVGGILTGDPEVTGRAKFHYDELQRLVRIEDQNTGCPNGYYEYEPMFSSICAYVRDWNFTYTDGGRLCKIEDPNGHFMYFWYDAAGRIMAMTDPRTAVSPAFPDGCGGPDPTEDAYVFGYDSDGRVTSVRDPDQATDPDDGMTQYFSGICGDLKITTTYTDRRGSDWEYLYDGSQFGLFPDANLVRTRGPIVDSYTNRVLDIDRNVLSVRDAIDRVWTATYDGNGNRLTWTDPLNHVQTWEYDSRNQETAYIDAVGNRTTYWYDITAGPYSARLTRIIEPTTYDLDADEWSGTATTTMTYNSDWLLASVTDPLGVVTRFEYDHWGQPKLYVEGEVEGQTAGGSVAVFSTSDRWDSAGRHVTSRAGYNTYDAGGNRTGSSCYIGFAAQSSGSVWPAGFPTLPGQITLSPVEAGYESAGFSPRGELLNLPLEMKDTGSGAVNRTFSNSFDALGRITGRTQVEGSISRSFDYKYDVPSGLTYRCGSDPVSFGVAASQTICTNTGSGSESEWVRDEAGRVIQFRRGPASNRVMSASYTYHDPLDLLRTVTYGNGASVEYGYDDANRVTEIRHRAADGATFLQLFYSWTDNDLPEQIIESQGDGALWHEIARTTFMYDERKRLVHEVRTEHGAYDLTYGYDQNGNRTKKIDALGFRRIVYHYDLEDPSLYGSRNNRLEYLDTFDTTGGALIPLSRTWYYYQKSSDRPNLGNVEYVVTGPPQGGINLSMMFGPPGGEGPSESGVPGEGESEFVEGGGGESTMGLLRGGYCGTLGNEFTAVRLEYAKNGEAVSYVLGEHWCSNSSGTLAPTSYAVQWASEYRYDGARQRYLNVRLNPAYLNAQTPSIVPLSITRSDYDGDDVYADWSEPIPGQSGAPALLRSFEPGIGRVEPWTESGGANTAYYHADMLGTTRMMSGPNGQPITTYNGVAYIGPAVYTAFGEIVYGPNDGEGNRYGYVGEHGYQAHTEFPWLHLGARYYDPTMGRFLQRDPIGIRGGQNVYTYARNAPPGGTDASGLWPDGPSSGADRWGDHITGQDKVRADPQPGGPPRVPSPRDIQKGAQWSAGLCAVGLGITAAPAAVAIGAVIGVIVIAEDVLEYFGVAPPAPDTWHEFADWG